MPVRAVESVEAYSDYHWQDVRSDRPASALQLRPGETLESADGALHTANHVLLTVHSKSVANAANMLVWNTTDGSVRRIGIAGGPIVAFAWDRAANEVLVRLAGQMVRLDATTFAEKRRHSFPVTRKAWRDMAILGDSLFVISASGTRLEVFDRSLKQTAEIPTGLTAAQRIFPYNGRLLLWSSYWSGKLQLFDPQLGRAVATLNAAFPPRALLKGGALPTGELAVFDGAGGQTGTLRQCGEMLLNLGREVQVGAAGRAYRYDPTRQTVRAVLKIAPTADVPSSVLIVSIPFRSNYAQEVIKEHLGGTLLVDEYGNRFVRVIIGAIRRNEKHEVELYRADVARFRSCVDIMAGEADLVVDGKFQKYMGDHRIYELQNPLVQSTQRRVTAGLDSYLGKIVAIHRFAMTIGRNWDGKSEPVPQVLRNMHGGCNEHTRVIVALLRISGIPARYAWNHLWKPGEAEFRNDHAIAEAWVAGIGWVPLEGLGRRAGFLSPYLFFHVGAPESYRSRPRAGAAALDLKKHAGAVVWQVLP